LSKIAENYDHNIDPRFGEIIYQSQPWKKDFTWNVNSPPFGCSNGSATVTLVHWIVSLKKIRKRFKK
jgi:hypothetical protein